MVDQIWNFLSHQLTTNQFFSGAALTGVLMSVVYQLRAVPYRLWHRLYRYIMFNTYIGEEDALYSNLDIYIQQKYPKQLRNVEVTSSKDGLALSHNNDYIYIWRKNRRILVSKSKKELTNASTVENRFSKSYTISGPWAKEVILEFLKEVTTFAEEYKAKITQERKKVEVYAMDYGEWSKVKDGSELKKFNDIYLPAEEKRLLIEDLEKFRKNADIYADMKMPFRRGYLFYGAPGNGKSTLAGAIAEHMGWDIFLMDLSNMTSSHQFTRAFKRLPENAVVNLEDIDTMFSNRENTDDDGTHKIKLTTLLNALSGVAQKNKLIVVITTNYVDKLDPALLREGRCDFKMEIKNPTKEVVEEYISRIFKQVIRLSEYVSKPFVHIQEAVIRNINDKERCINIIEKGLGTAGESPETKVRKRPVRYIQV